MKIRLGVAYGVSWAMASNARSKTLGFLTLQLPPISKRLVTTRSYFGACSLASRCAPANLKITMRIVHSRARSRQLLRI